MSFGRIPLKICYQLIYLNTGGSHNQKCPFHNFFEEDTWYIGTGVNVHVW